MADTVTVATQFSLTQTQLIWRDFKRHRAALVGGVVIGLLYFTALLAEPIAPYDPFHREIKSPWCRRCSSTYATQRGDSIFRSCMRWS